jgi:hypothetical protein
MPTTITLYRDPSHPRADKHGRVQARLHPWPDASSSRPVPRTAMRRSRLDTAARWTLLTAYAIAGVALTLWALLSRGPFY